MTMLINSFEPNTADPYYSFVTLLMGFDGSIADEKAGLTVANNGTSSATTVSSPAQPYGSAWMQLVAVNLQYLSLAETSNQFYLSGDFTIEVTVRVTTFPSPSFSGIFSQYQSVGAQRSWYLYADGTGGTNTIGFNVSGDGVNVVNIGTVTVDDTGAALATGVTYRMCVERFGNTWRLYVNGKTITTATSAQTIFNSSEPLLIGAHNVITVSQYFDGYLDEVRITNGFARYRGDYAPAVSRFPRH